MYFFLVFQQIFKLNLSQHNNENTVYSLQQYTHQHLSVAIYFPTSKVLLITNFTKLKVLLITNFTKLKVKLTTNFTKLPAQNGRSCWRLWLTDLLQVGCESGDSVNEGCCVAREGRLHQSLGGWSSPRLSLVVRDAALQAVQHLAMWQSQESETLTHSQQGWVASHLRSIRTNTG